VASINPRSQAARARAGEGLMDHMQKDQTEQPGQDDWERHSPGHGSGSRVPVCAHGHRMLTICEPRTSRGHATSGGD